jgi:transposase
MAKFKKYDYNQMMMVPVVLKDQLMKGTMEYAINEIVDKKVDITYFLEKYTNDDTGRPTYDPRILLKVILLAYSRGIIGSRRIEKLCRENITFMALTCGQAPDHSTIAHFISSMKKEVIHIFRDILLLCDGMDLLGGTHFSLDGLKLPSNVSKEWSGTFKDLKKKKGKLEEKLKQVIHEHEKQDKKGDFPEDRRDKQIKRLEKKIKRIERFLQEEEPKEGKTKNELQSNITDNESAKMPTFHGVIQGYNSQAFVDSKHQVIMHAEVFGNGQDHDNLAPMLEGAKGNMESIGKGSDYFEDRILSCDANYHNKANLEKCETEKIDAYIPDVKFRKRDERYAAQGRFKGGITHRKKVEKIETPRDKRFALTDFVYDEKENVDICPNKKVLRRKTHRIHIGNIVYDLYRVKETDCRACSMRLKCLSKKEVKQKHLLIALEYAESVSLIEKMKQKIDSPEGRRKYSRRLAIVEPVFANIRCHKRLDRFTLRSKVKVNVQWLLYAMVHNIEKILHYGMA